MIGGPDGYISRSISIRSIIECDVGRIRDVHYEQARIRVAFNRVNKLGISVFRILEIRIQTEYRIGASSSSATSGIAASTIGLSFTGLTVT